MSLVAVLLVISSALLHAIRNYFTKTAGDKQAFLWWYELAASLIYLPVFIYFAWQVNADYQRLLIFSIGSGFVHFLYWICLAKSYEKGDLSLVYPIMRSSPAPVLLLSFIFLNEKVSSTGAAGILIVALGVYLIGIERLNWQEFSKPVRALRQNESVRWAFLTLLGVTAYSLVDKVGAEQFHPVLFVYLLHFFSFVFFSIYISQTRTIQELKKEFLLNRTTIAINGVLVLASYFLILVAFQTEPVSYVVGLRQLSIVFAVLLGGRLLKEEHQGVRFLASMMIFAGSFLIAIAQ